MFAIGLVGFGVTSLACGLAWNFESLIVFRLLQGAAGALLVPGSLAILNTTFSGEERGRAFGIWAGASAGTTILGPFVGGHARAGLLVAGGLPHQPPAGARWRCGRRCGTWQESRDEEMSGRLRLARAP